MGDEDFDNHARRPLKVVLACSGLGHRRRGFEVFTEECFRALRDDPRLDLVLAKGAGERRRRELRIVNAPADSRATKALGRWLGRDSYYAEQLTFAAGLLPHLAWIRPRLVVVSDWMIGTCLWRWRELARRRFRVLLVNGAPYGPPFPRSDHVQQVTEAHLAAALAAGEPPEKHSLVPYGFFLREAPVAGGDVRPLRRRRDLPLDRRIVISVGALAAHKRHEHLVRSVARLADPPFVLLLGHGSGRETAELAQLAASELGPEGFAVRTAQPNEVWSYYAASDVFALASLSEGFGRVFVEACASGLPCLVHDFPVAREVLGRWGTYVDMRDPTALTDELRRAPASGTRPSESAEAQRREMIDRFDWSSLRDRYVQMFQRAAWLGSYEEPD